MQHKGAILEQIVRKKSRSVTELAEKMGYDRATLYRHFKTEDLSDVILYEYAKALRYDFRKEFPEVAEYGMMLAEPIEEYRALSLSDALKEVDHWKNKYIALLERYNDVLKEKLEGH